MNRSEIAKKAWKTRKAKAAGKKAAITRKRRNAGQKAAATRRARSHAKQADAPSHEPLAGPADARGSRRIPLNATDPSHLIEQHFHEVIRHRVVDEGRLRLPQELPHLDAGDHERCWFPVPGMAGGFAFQWDATSTEPRLILESWCRVVDGSGQRHHITVDGARLVEEGFV